MRYRTVPLDIQEALSLLRLYSNGVTLKTEGVTVSYYQQSAGWYVSASVETPSGVRYSEGHFARLDDAAGWLVKQSNWMAREIEDAL